MPLVRYRSCDGPAFAVFDRSRFRVDHGVFYIRPGPLRDRIAGVLDEHRGWDLRVMKLVQENRRLQACAEWLDSLPDGGDEVVVPEIQHVPALDLVADRLIGDGEFERVECPACAACYAPEQVRRDPWEFEEDGVVVRGRTTSCQEGHILHALTDAIDVPELELPDD